MTDLFEYFRTDLVSRWAGLHDQYNRAKPYPHIVVDNFLPIDVAEQILEKFPKPDHPLFSQPNVGKHQVRKLGRIQEGGFQGIDRQLRTTLFEFNSMAFLNSLEAITGIKGLIPDPHFKGGAFHQILPGGKINIHADFSTDARRMLTRRINVLIYLNKDWRPEYNGELELWSEDMKECVVSIAPIFNRCVIFNTTRTSYHGHPVPLAPPEGVTRKSLALYYYTSDESVFDSATHHVTLWQTPKGGRPD